MKKLLFSAFLLMMMSSVWADLMKEKSLEGVREPEMVLGEGEISFKQGPYEIFFSTFNTSFISPQVAKAYGIVRSKSKALVNISVVRDEGDGKKSIMPAKVSGQTFDLILTKKLDFFEVKEQTAVYYLAQFDIEHKVPFYFTINVVPQGRQTPIKVQFKKTLWVDGKD